MSILFRGLPEGAFAGAIDARPTDRLPVVRLDKSGDAIAELRSWGFRRMIRGASGNLVKKALINAVGERVTSTSAFRAAFKGGARCLVPMAGWYEWPVIDGRKTQVHITMRSQPIFFAAGLYESAADPKSGQPVETFTFLTVSPNEFLGTTHDRAPLVLQNADLDMWLTGDPHQAQALIESHPDPEAFAVAPLAAAPV